MSSLINFPQGPLIGPDGNLSLEWFLFFQNPQVISIIIQEAIGVESGGTGLNSGISGGVLAFTGATTMASSQELENHRLVLGGGAGSTPSTPVGLGTSNTVLHGNASGNPSWGAVNLASDVSGLLPVANGGTGSASPSLIAGGGITISGSFPNQTVSANGGGYFGTVSLTTNQAGPSGMVFATLVSGNILTSAGKARAVCQLAGSKGVSGTVFARLVVDGVVVKGSLVSVFGGFAFQMSFQAVTGPLGAGSHTFAIEWTSDTISTVCNAGTDPDYEYAEIIVSAA